jgi:hypothetical protein
MVAHEWILQTLCRTDQDGHLVYIVTSEFTNAFTTYRGRLSAFQQHYCIRVWSQLEVCPGKDFSNH